MPRVPRSSSASYNAAESTASGRGTSGAEAPTAIWTGADGAAGNACLFAAHPADDNERQRADRTADREQKDETFHAARPFALFRAAISSPRLASSERSSLPFSSGKISVSSSFT